MVDIETWNNGEEGNNSAGKQKDELIVGVDDMRIFSSASSLAFIWETKVQRHPKELESSSTEEIGLYAEYFSCLINLFRALYPTLFGGV